MRASKQGAFVGKLQGKQAIITGAASGIGRASALLFAERGAKLVLTDLNTEGLEETASLMRASRPDVPLVAVAGDAADPVHVARLVSLCTEAHGTPNVFFANAGIAGMRGLMEESLEEWQRILRVNLL